MNTTAPCPECAGPMHPITRRARLRREGHVVAYQAEAWQCDACSTPDDPYIYVSDEQRSRNVQAAARAWEEKVGGEVPPKKKAGRKTLSAYTEVMTIRVTPDAMESLEELRRIRGTKTIARLMRALIDEEVARVELGRKQAG